MEQPALMLSTRAEMSRISMEASTNAAVLDATSRNRVVRREVVSCSCVKIGRKF